MAATADRIDRVSVRIMADLLGVTVEEYAARRMKNSPGQMSLWDDNATGSNLLRAPERQKSFDWDESKHPRAEDGKFAEAGAAGESGGGGAAVAEVDEDDEDDEEKPEAKEKLARVAEKPKGEEKDQEPKKYAPGVHATIIPGSAAYNAHRGTSFVPDERARQVQAEFVSTMNGKYEEFSKAAKTDDQKATLEEAWPEFLSRAKSAYMAMLGARSNVMSMMITGPARFPTSRNEKKSDTYEKRVGEYLEGLEKGSAAMRRKMGIGGSDAIRIGDKGSGSELEKKLEQLEKFQEKAKQINAAVRKVIDSKSRGDGPIFKKGFDLESGVKFVMETAGVEEKTARGSLKPDFAGRYGIPNYALTNNNANMKRVREQIAKQAKFEQKAESAKAGEKPTEFSFEGGGISLDYDDNRIRIKHDKKPDRDVIDKLKRSGWRWSPSNGAWQRQLTSDAERSAKEITGADLSSGASASSAPRGFSFAQHVKLAAESIDKLRKSDVFRLIDQAPSTQAAKFVAEEIGRQRPDLKGEADQSIYDFLQDADSSKYAAADRLADRFIAEAMGLTVEQYDAQKKESEVTTGKHGDRGRYVTTDNGSQIFLTKSGEIGQTGKNIGGGSRPESLPNASFPKSSGDISSRTTDAAEAAMAQGSARRNRPESLPKKTMQHPGGGVGIDLEGRLPMQQQADAGGTQSLPEGDSAAGPQYKSPFVQSFAQSIMANIRKYEESQRNPQPAGPDPRQHPHHHSNLPGPLRQSLLNWSADINTLAQPIGWARQGASASGGDTSGAMKSAFGEVSRNELSRVFQNLDRLLETGKQQGIDLRPFVRHNKLIPRTIAAKLKPSDLFDPVQDEERYAARAAKNSPGQMSLWDDNATGSNLLRTSARQKSFDWDESKVKRDPEGKFAEKSSGGESGKGAGKKTHKTAADFLSEGKTHAEYANYVSKLYTDEKIGESEWNKMHAESPSINDWSNAKNLVGRDVVGSFPHKRGAVVGKVTGFEVNSGRILAVIDDGEGKQHKVDPEWVDDLYSKVGRHAKEGRVNAEYLSHPSLKKMIEGLADKVGQGNSVTKVIDEHFGEIPGSKRMDLHRAIANAYMAKSEEQERKRAEPSAARKAAMEKATARDSAEARKPPKGFNFKNHVKIAADSIESLRKSDVSRLVESTPNPETAQFVADEIGRLRPDLKSEADESIYDFMKEVGGKYSAVDAWVDRYMAQALGITVEQYAQRRLKSSPGQMEFQWITVHPPGHEKGQPVMVSKKDGTIAAGMGGKFNGQKIGEIGRGGSGDSEKPAEKKTRLEVLKGSLTKKQENFDKKISGHFDDVKSANMQPLNDKRGGQKTMDRWDKQSDSLRNLNKGIEKTKKAIEREEELISNVESADTPDFLKEMIKSGDLKQWRKYPNHFFVEGVDKGRIVWNPEHKTLSHKYLDEIPKDQYPAFRDAFNKANNQLKKKAILDYLAENPSASVAEISKSTGIRGHKYGDTGNPLDKPLNKMLKEMSDSGEIETKSSSMGSVSFSAKAKPAESSPAKSSTKGSLTSQQQSTISGMSKLFGFDFESKEPRSIKRNAIAIKKPSNSREEVMFRQLESHGLTTGKFRIEPNGVSELAIILNDKEKPKSSQYSAADSLVDRFMADLLGLSVEQYAARKRKSSPGQQEFDWITVHPNGAGTKGVPVMIDRKDGTIKAGMGGKFDGQKVGEIGGKGGGGGGGAKPTEKAAKAKAAKPASDPQADRQKIADYLASNPNATIHDIAKATGLKHHKYGDSGSPTDKPLNKALREMMDSGEIDHSPTPMGGSMSTFSMKAKGSGAAPEASDDGDDWPETTYTPEESAKHRDSAISKGLDRIKATPHIKSGAQAESQAQDAWYSLNNDQRAQFSGYKEFSIQVGKAFTKDKNAAESPDAETLDDHGLYRKFNGRHQYKFNPAANWMTANSEADAIEQATKAYRGIPADQRKTRAQRNEAADQQAFEKMDGRYGKLSIDQLEDKHAELKGAARDRSDREFTGTASGRRIGPAVKNEGARGAGQEALELGIYIKDRKAKEGAKPAASASGDSHAYFGGNKGRKTGKVETIHGGEFEEIEMLEGKDKGKMKMVPTKKQSDENTKKSQDTWKKQQEQFRGLKNSEPAAKPAPAPSSFVPEMIPGQQASLFGGDDLNTGQKSLFNMVRPTKADQRAANRGAGPAPASLLEQIDDEQRKVADSRKSLPGQRDLLAGDGGGVDSRQPHEMTKAEYEKQVSQIKPKPTEYLNVGKTMVIQNPTPDDHRFLSSQAREKFPNMPKGEAVVRKTKDKKGNQYIWMAHEATHGMIEPEISKIVGEDLNQNHDIPTHKDHLREALRTGMKIPKAVQDEYPQYADLFNNGGKYSTAQLDRFIERYRAGSSTKKDDAKPKTVTGTYGDRGRFITVGEGEEARRVFLPGSVKKIKETGEYRTDNSRAKAQADRKKAKASGGGKFVPVSKVEKAIVSTVGDHPTDVKEFSTIVEQVYREKSEIVRDKIAAIREITAMAGYDRKNAGGFIRSIRAAGDYDKIPRFDQMADYAQRKYPHILAEAKGHGNSHEDALFAILKDGIPEMPNKDDEEVMNAAWERSGYDQTGKPSEWESSDGGSQDDDDFVPFSASLAARMSIERYRAAPQMAGAPQFMRRR